MFTHKGHPVHLSTLDPHDATEAVKELLSAEIAGDSYLDPHQQDCADAAHDYIVTLEHGGKVDDFSTWSEVLEWLTDVDENCLEHVTDGDLAPDLVYTADINDMWAEYPDEIEYIAGEYGIEGTISEQLAYAASALMERWTAEYLADMARALTDVSEVLTELVALEIDSDDDLD